MTRMEKIFAAFKIIQADDDYANALTIAEELMDAEPDTPEADALEALAVIINKYEDEHYPIETPSLIEALEFRMEQQGFSQTDLAVLLHSKSRASEIRNGKRKPTLAQAALLHKEWRIPAESIFASA